jgi:4-aminobutyrate aminotransferase
MVAMDVVKGRDLTLDPARRDEIVQAAFHSGLLLLGCGESAIRFCPPLCVTAEQVETMLRILSGVMAGQKAAKVAV